MQAITHDPSVSSHPAEADAPRQIAVISPIAIQKSLLIQVVAQNSLKEKNVVWLSPGDFAELFGSEALKTSGPHYLQVANKVYKTMLATMPQGSIGMSDMQMDDVQEGVYQIG